MRSVEKHPSNYTYLPTSHSYAHRGPVERPPTQNHGVVRQYFPPPHPYLQLRRHPASGWWHTTSKSENTTLNRPRHTGHSHSGVIALHAVMMCDMPVSPSALLPNTGHLVCCAMHSLQGTRAYSISYEQYQL